MSDYAVAAGDVVKLAQPYRPRDWASQQPLDWPGFEFGVVAEVEENDRLSLFLYDRAGQLFVAAKHPAQALLVPTLVDFTFDQLERYQALIDVGSFWDGI